MTGIQIDVTDSVASLVLNRPAALNALSLDMIDSLTSILTQWADDDAVREVEISGVGRAFCAGADVRELRTLVLDQSGDPVDFLAREYRLDRLIASYPKPYRAIIHGIAMGGGLGVSIHAAHRVVSTDTVMAMPETIIGLWPDVGMCYHLSRMPGEVGTYMGLTGLSITGADAVACHLADELVGSHTPGSDTATQWMAPMFAGDDIVAIMDRLENSRLPQAREAARVLRLRSPLSVVVTLQALRRAATLSVDEVFDQDLRLGAFFCRRPDFIEGVRAQLIDKDFSPQWSHARIEDVAADEVQAAFEG
ncbi:MAG: enoyl-CoA hydratase/isomerase family protein [Propionibacteriaceae bacterium]|nr:enoyl-CoA hydratase/isomerase family protein [Propionibacteriaceae bacterium]